MKLTILAVGRIKRSPERELLADYLERATKTGTPLGFRKIEEVELESGGGLHKEGERILAKLPKEALIIRLDERGKTMRSEAFAHLLQTNRDEGQNICFLIGGADGYADAVKTRVTQTMSLGDLTWPHKLARVMLAEQIYRAISILAGTPYHKD